MSNKKTISKTNQLFIKLTKEHPSLTEDQVIEKISMTCKLPDWVVVIHLTDPEHNTINLIKD